MSHPPPKKPTPNHKLQLSPRMEPRGDGDVPCPAPGELHPSPPSIRTPQEKREKRRSRADIPLCHRTIQTPAPPPAPRGGISTLSTHAFGGGPPPAWPPQPHFPAAAVSFPAGLCCSGSTATPPSALEMSPPAPMIHHFVAANAGALPVPHSTAEKRRTGKPRHGKGGSGASARAGAGGGWTRNTRAVNSALRSVEKEIKTWLESQPPSQTPGCWSRPVAASPTPERFPTDKGGRQSQHPWGGAQPASCLRGQSPHP